MKTFLGLAIALALAAPAQTRVGIFDKPSVVVAYYRSPMWADVLRAKRAERDAASKSGDSKKVEELDAWGPAQQDLAHRQLAGEAPITNILEALQPAFAEIAKTAHLDRILTGPPPAGGHFETVDVTDQLIDWLKADERTRNIIRDLRGKARQ